MEEQGSFLQSIVSWIFKIILELGKHIIPVLIIGMVYLMFWNFPQTNDLLLVLNQPRDHFKEMLFFFAGLTVLAFLISNLNDYLNGTKGKAAYVPMDSKEKAISKGEESEYDNKETEDQYLERMLPKVLGTILLLITTFAVEHTFHTITNNVIFIGAGWGLSIFLFLLLLSLYQKIGQWFARFMKKWDKMGFITLSLAVLCLLIITILGFFNRGGSDEDIVRLFWAFLLLSLFFFIVSVSYSRLILKFKKNVGVFLIAGLTAIAFVLYLVFLFVPGYAADLNPLTVILVFLIGLFSVAQAIKVLGVKLKLPLLSVVVFVLFIWGGITAAKKEFDHYEVSHTKRTISANERPGLKEHIRSWIEDRQDTIANSKKFPVIFVAAEGGGSRAGLWSFLIHSKLYKTNPDYFNTYLFSLTGASGGNVGNNMFYNAAYEAFLKDRTINLENSGAFRYKASTVYDENYLSSSIASLLGRDLAESISGMFRFNDRAELLEGEWASRYSNTFKGTIAPSINREFLSFIPKKGNKGKTPPIILVNTTHLQSGDYSVISPVNLVKDSLGTHIFRDFLVNYERAANK
ncbi:MAG: hypothetical protein AAF361_12040, partial [Bacteroidota bacterium]